MSDPREIPMPLGYYLAASGDPIAHFGNGTAERPWLMLQLHDDGSVTWREATKDDVEAAREAHRG